MAKKTKAKQAGKAMPETLGDQALDKVSGGWELEPARVTSYSISGNSDGSTAGGGPHVKVFSGG